MKHIFFVLSLFCAVVLFAQDGSLVKDVQTPLPPNSIHFTGYLESKIQNSLEHWNKGNLPYSQFVEFFRQGRPQFALGEMWGKAVRSGAMFYRYQPDPELKQILDATVKDMLSTQRENGSISCVPPDQQPETSDLWERKYVLLGFEDYYEYVNQDPAVLESLVKQADALIAVVGEAPKKSILDVGWSATNVGKAPNHIESSTLLEPFVRLYKLTGHKRYLDFATYIIECGGCKEANLFDKAVENVLPHEMCRDYPKAYDMLSLFEGLVEYYRLTDNPRWKQAALNLFQNVRKHEITVLGNGGSDQPYHPKVAGEAWGNTAVEQTNPNIKRMMETCTGVTWMKYCSQILRLTGDSAAADEIEKYVYNGLIGAMKPSGDGFSYVNLLNGQKVNDHGWGREFGNLHVTCCNLNGPEGLAYLPYIAVMKNEAGLVINLYNAADVSMQTPQGQPLKLKIESDFPYNGNVKIRFVSVGGSSPNEEFALQLRIPAWSEKTLVKVNDDVTSSVANGKYYTIKRRWQFGDTVELKLDVRCRLLDAQKGITPNSDRYKAVMAGPIVLARHAKTDVNYNKPVSIIADANGYIDAKFSRNADGVCEFTIPVKGGAITMFDYASINAWDGSHIQTWLPMDE
jgi:DUF1680 family protein